MTSDLDRLLSLVSHGLSTNSGIYAAADPELRTRMNSRGEYEYVGLDSSYEGPASTLLAVSAIRGTGKSEDAVARELFGGEPGVRHDSVAGYYVGAFAGWVNDPTLRQGASSGGLTTWTLRQMMRSGAIDAVIHMRPGGEGDPLFTYQISRSEEQLVGGAKSRYYPGQIGDVLQEVRKTPGRYAFVGIPSFVYELRLLQAQDAILKERITQVVGLICGHQKTASYATYLAWRAGIHPKNLRAIDFRKKVPGRPANSYSTEVTGEVDGKLVQVVLAQHDLYGTDWGYGFFKSNFSDLTEDALNETADLVVGDAWLPEYMRDSRGSNVVLVRSAELLAVLEQGKASNEIHLEEMTIERLIKSQSALTRHNIDELPFRFALLKRAGEPLPQMRRRASRVPLTRKLVQRARLATSRTSHEAYEAALAADDLRVFDTTMRPLTNRYNAAQDLHRGLRILASGPKATLTAARKRLAKARK